MFYPTNLFHFQMYLHWSNLANCLSRCMEPWLILMEGWIDLSGSTVILKFIHRRRNTLQVVSLCRLNITMLKFETEWNASVVWKVRVLILKCNPLHINSECSHTYELSLNIPVALGQVWLEHYLNWDAMNTLTLSET